MAATKDFQIGKRLRHKQRLSFTFQILFIPFPFGYSRQPALEQLSSFPFSFKNDFLVSLIYHFKTSSYEKYKDAILLFRVGDFYETFNEDAAIGSQMDILVTVGNENGDAKKKANLPVYSWDHALQVLTKRGYKVAVCEQLEAPKPGYMKRGVTDTFSQSK